MKETFGERITRLRKEKQLTQSQVAAILQVSSKAISHYENDTREPSLATLVQMSELFRVDIDYLLGVEKGLIINTAGLSDRECFLIRELVYELAIKKPNKK